MPHLLAGLDKNFKQWPVQGRGASGGSKAAESQVHDNEATSWPKGLTSSQ